MIGLCVRFMVLHPSQQLFVSQVGMELSGYIV